MEETKSILESCSELTLEELESLSLTKMVRNQGGEPKFIGLGVLDENGYLLEYHELKKIYVGLNYFLRNISPDVISTINEQKKEEDQIQREKEELIELVAKNIVDKKDIQEQEETGSIFSRLFRSKK